MKDGFQWRITSEDKAEMIDAFQYSGTVSNTQTAMRRECSDTSGSGSQSHSLTCSFCVSTVFYDCDRPASTRY